MVTATIVIYEVNCKMMQLKRKFGDRYDGYRVKKVDPFFFPDSKHYADPRRQSGIFFR